MKGLWTVGLVVVVLLSAVLLTMGCGSESSVFVDLIKKVPHDSSTVDFMDIEKLRDDPDFEGAYEDWKMAYDLQGQYGINHDQVETFIMTESIYLVQGGFDMSDVVDRLLHLGYEYDRYKDVERWSSGNVHVALMERMVVAGSKDGVESCIKIAKGEDSSLYEKRDARDVVEKLPHGLQMWWALAASYSELEGLEASGMSLAKEDRDILKMTTVCKFTDEGTAEDSGNTLKQEWEDSRFGKVDTKIDGIYVTIRGEISIDEFGEPDILE